MRTVGRVLPGYPARADIKNVLIWEVSMENDWLALQTQLRTGSIDRRTFLARAAAFGISATMTGTALAQTPKRGGHVAFGMMSAQTSDTLDPTTWRAEFMYGVGGQMYDSLVYVDEQGKA